MRSRSLHGSIRWVLPVSGWFSVSKTIIPEAGSTFSSPHHAATLIFSVDWGLVRLPKKLAVGEWILSLIRLGLTQFLAYSKLPTILRQLHEQMEQIDYVARALLLMLAYVCMRIRTESYRYIHPRYFAGSVSTPLHS